MLFVQKFFGAVRSLRKHCVRSGSVAQAGSVPDIAEQFDSDQIELSTFVLSQNLTNVHENCLTRHL